MLHQGTRGRADKLLLSPPLAAPSHGTREKKTETQIKSYSAKLIASTCFFPVSAFPCLLSLCNHTRRHGVRHGATDERTLQLHRQTPRQFRKQHFKESWFFRIKIFMVPPLNQCDDGDELVVGSRWQCENTQLLSL